MLNEQGMADRVAAAYAGRTLYERAAMEDDLPSSCDCGIGGLCFRHQQEQKLIHERHQEVARRMGQV